MTLQKSTQEDMRLISPKNTGPFCQCNPEDKLTIRDIKDDLKVGDRIIHFRFGVEYRSATIASTDLVLSNGEWKILVRQDKHSSDSYWSLYEIGVCPKPDPGNLLNLKINEGSYTRLAIRQ